MRPGLVLLALLLVLYVVAACTPISTVTFGRWDEHPMRHSMKEAHAFAIRAIPPFGALPTDAHLVWGGTLVRQSFHPSAKANIEANFEWRPRDVLASEERIFISVGEDNNGNLLVKQMIRQWYPGWWRATQQWWIQRTAVAIAPPSQLRNSCANGVDSQAASRVLGSTLTYLVYGGMGWPTPPPLGRAAAAEASWNGTVTMRGAEYRGGGGTFPIQARAAWISDTPEKPLPSYREVMLLTQPFLERGNPIWRWTTYASADVEHVCR